MYLDPVSPREMESATTPFLTEDVKSGEHHAKETIYGDEVLNSQRQHRQQRMASWKILTCLFATWGVLSLFLSVYQAIFLLPPPSTRDVYRPETLPPRTNLCECGQTAEEALTLNCIYDSLSTAWLPPHCRDDELTAEFDRSGPGVDGKWTYFADENGTVPLSKVDLAALGPAGGAFWTSRDWHVAHCLFYWLKYKRMSQTGAVMEARFDTVKHIKHCSRLARRHTPDYFFLIEVPVRMNGTVDPVGGRVSGPLAHMSG